MGSEEGESNNMQCLRLDHKPKIHSNLSESL